MNYTIRSGLIMACALWPALAAVPAAAETPATCTVGAYVISLYDFELENDSFRADLWFWSTCDEDVRPLDVMDFPTAMHIERTLPATSRRGDQYWSYVKISGVFRHSWDVRNFPFDRHDLKLEIEHTAAPASEFSYTPDVAGSSTSPEVTLDQWRVTDFRVKEYTYTYNTVFGDPAFEGRKVSDYSRIALVVSVERKNVVGFFKLTAGVYVSFAFAMLAFFLGTETSARTGMLVGTLFAVLVNQRVAEVALGRAGAFTLVDQIHTIAMVFIFAGAFGALLNRSLNLRGHAVLAKRIDRIGYIASLILYCAVNAWVIWRAGVLG